MVHSKLLNTLAGLKPAKIMVVGDLILDRYVWGNSSRISPEAPIPVLQIDDKFDNRAGGAGNVASNIVALGANVMLASVVGSDMAAEDLLSALTAQDVDCSLVLTDASRPTSTKTRYLAGSQQILRTDIEEIHPLDESLHTKFLNGIQAQLDSISLIILSDYNKGVLGSELCQQIISLANGHDISVLVDPKGKDYRKYSGATIITPNQLEAQDAATFLGLDHDDLQEVGQGLCTTLKCENITITMGAKGVEVFSQTGQEFRYPTVARSVFDVTGAGDTYIATLGYCLAGGVALEGAVRLANIAAGVSVGLVGTVTISLEDLRQALYRGATHSLAKRQSKDDLVSILANARAQNKRIVFTNGCFDILHVGHVRYLSFARNQGDLLVIGLNSDESISRIKGPDRPITPQDQRAELLAALEDVGYVVTFNEDTPYELISALQPDILVKGEDWKDKGAIGSDIVEARGGKVVYAPYIKGNSTSDIIRKTQGLT